MDKLNEHKKNLSLLITGFIIITIEIAAGFSYGTIEGMAICLLGAIIGTIVIYAIVNRYGIKLVNHFYDTNKFNEISFLKKENG